MASHRVGENGLSADSGSSNYPVFHGISHPVTNYINQQESAFDLGELEEAIVLQGVKNRNDEAKRTFLPARPAATLEMFPSWPMRFQQTPRGSSRSGDSTDSGSAQNTFSFQTDSQLEPESPLSEKASNQAIDQKPLQQHHQIEMANDTSKTGASPIQQAKPSEKRRGAGSASEKTLDAKTLRRLAQNREAARKSRLRKKAYVQQLETSRIKLTQLEQELQRARSQGLFLSGAGGAAGGSGSISSGAAMFDMEYARWLEDDQRHMSELRTALQARLSDGDLRIILDGYLAHFDEIFRLKGIAAKSDVFHLVTGMWAAPAERCFLWMGGFRPSELIKILLPQLDTLTEQQFMGICSLQQSSQQAEEALSQGLEQLQQSLADTVASGSLSEGTHVGNYMDQMAMALSKLSNLEGFVRQADNLRQQTLHQMRRILTIRQAARCFLAIGEYYVRLRALSSLWTSRPRENWISDDNSSQTTMEIQMVPPCHNPFSTF